MIALPVRLQAQNMLKVMCGELESLTDPVPRDALERAKHMSISLIHNALESKSASAEDMGRQFLTYGHRWGCLRSLCVGRVQGI